MEKDIDRLRTSLLGLNFIYSFMLRSILNTIPKEALFFRIIKSDESTLYTQLARFEESEEFHVKTASAPKEIESLLEVGFEYICEKEGLMFF